MSVKPGTLKRESIKKNTNAGSVPESAHDGVGRRDLWHGTRCRAGTQKAREQSSSLFYK